MEVPISGRQSGVTEEYAPAIDALVRHTVWNHIGRKYMMEKLHVATRKFEHPTNTGIGCFSNAGANTGSGATKSSTTTKPTAKTAANVHEVITKGSDHYPYHVMSV